MRENSDQEFAVIFSKVQEIATTLSVDIKVPRTAARQKNRANYSTTDPESYYRQAHFIPYLDHTIASLTNREAAFENYSLYSRSILFR